MDRAANMLEFFFEGGALIVGAKRFDLVTPAGGIAADQQAARCALRGAFGLAKVDLTSKACARITADVTIERPAHRRIRFAVVIDVLLGHVRIVKGEL